MSDLDTAQTLKFLQALEPDVKNHAFSFYTMKPRKPNGWTQKEGMESNHLQKPLLEVYRHLCSANKGGYGVFVVVNEASRGLLRHPKDEDITRVRALFADFDQPGQEIPTFALEPSMIVQTSPGKFHYYWLTTPGEEPDIREFQPMQESLIKLSGSDPSVKDLRRILRVPGFYHAKDGKVGELVTIQQYDQTRRYTASQFREWLKPAQAIDRVRDIAHGWQPTPGMLEVAVTQYVARVYLATGKIKDDGGIDIECPWSDEHTTGGTTAMYWPPTPGNNHAGGFKCQHSHCQQRRIGDFTKFCVTAMEAGHVFSQSK